MPDIKYVDEAIARKYSLVKDYYPVAKAAVKEMHRQVGDLVVEDGVAVRGLIIRHLVLPDGLAGTAEVMRFIARELSVHSYVNVMAQYRPENKADRHPELIAADHRATSTGRRCAWRWSRGCTGWRARGRDAGVSAELRGRRLVVSLLAC